jgi:hypothetical protein
MALMITDTSEGNSRSMLRAVGRGVGLQAHAVFVREQEGLWHS